MNMFCSYRKTFVPLAVLLLLLSSIVLPSSTILSSSSPSTLDINEDDGVYYLDGFSFSDVDLSDNCTIPAGSTKITLDPEGTDKNMYDFSTWTTYSENSAYTYNTIYFIPFYPPSMHISFFEEEFPDIGYDEIGQKDNVTYPLEQFGEPTPLQQVHHFRIKITQDVNTTSKLTAYWYGKAEQYQTIAMYYWQPLMGFLGIWKKVDEISFNESLNNTMLQLNFMIDEAPPVDSEDYVDICIVVTPAFGEKCALFSDYINITVFGEGYATHGTVISKQSISPQQITQWEIFTWDDYTEGNTKITYQLLYETDSGNTTLVEEQYLSGNKYGFTTPPISLKNVPITYNLSIKANLQTSDLSVSPAIYSWGLTWQTEKNKWKDLFTSDLRISKDDKRNIIIENGNVSVIPSAYDWPMFGQNPSNTRSSDGKGPSSTTNSLRWYTSVEVGGEQRNPVVKNNIVYIASSLGDKIYAFDAHAETGSSNPNPWIAKATIPQYEITSSPAVNDEIIVVATGTSSKYGNRENKIYAYNKDDLTNDYLWSFEYSSIHPDKPYICFSGSPIIADEKIYITSWSGDSSIWNMVWDTFNFTRGNNKLICLDVNGNFQWEYDLPAGSFSTPAYYNGRIIVGCENLLGDSVFAINTNGQKIWSKNVGPIGETAPLIHDGKVFVVAKKPASIPFSAYTEIVALSLNTGEILWNASIGDNQPESYRYAGCNSPAAHGGKVFVASPDGILYAFDSTTGDKLWEKTVYDKGILPINMVSSPAYADGRIYIGTPDGQLYALNASTGEIEWSKTTIQGSGVVSSPVITDGLVIYCTENGIMQCRGEIQIPEGEEYTGYLISIPLYLKEGYEWDRFYASTTTSNGNITFQILNSAKTVILNNVHNDTSLEPIKTQSIIRLRADLTASTTGQAVLHDWMVTFKKIPGPSNETIFYENSFTSNGTPPLCSIDVQNEHVGLWVNSAEYRFEYTDNATGKQISDWIPANCTGSNGSTARETITANLSGLNFTENITHYWQIQFSILDSQGNATQSEWHNISKKEYPPDEAKPVFYSDSFTPSGGWITTATPVCTINAQDRGTDDNISGINVASARYTLEYMDKSETGPKIHVASAQCSGTNGTTSNVTITADISLLPFSKNITSVKRIRFSIADMAGNENMSSWFEFQMDTEKPVSWITNTADIPSQTNVSPVLITAAAEDNVSGVKSVALYYRKTTETTWSQFTPIRYTEPYQWDFTIGRNDGGEYELCTIATDNADNVEEFPVEGDKTFLFDPNEPYKPVFKSEYRFTTPSIPSFSDVEFKDDYKLKKVEYRLNFEGINEWTQLNQQDINQKTYKPSWNLTLDQWNTMYEDQTYYVYFRVTDVLGNVYETPTSNEAMKLVKDLKNETIYDPDLSDFDDFHWDNWYTIRVHVNKTQVTKLQLWYTYSPDNKTWGNWTRYGKNLTNGTFEWRFYPKEGNGYYGFRVDAWDTTGQKHTSATKYVKVTLFPFFEIMLMSTLVIILIAVTVLVFRKYQGKR